MASTSIPDVRIVSTTRIPLLRRPPPHLEQIPLSLFDAWFLPQPPIQRLFLYSDADGDTSSLIESLKSSLADVIAVYFPLAGKLTHVASTGDVVIDCSPSAVGDGVAFVEAEADGYDARAMSAGERQDVAAFLRLLPALEADELPAPVLAVQATRFVAGGGGGVAVGVAVHHAVVDGHSFWRFMDAWSAAACRGRRLANPPSPVFDRSAIVLPMAADVARRILRKVTPELPRLPTENLLRRTWEHHDTSTLELDRRRIAGIKNRIAKLNDDRPLPSTFVAVSALVWSTIVRARSTLAGGGVADAARAHLVFLGDCRPRLHPPVDAAYFGNCIRGCVAEAAARDLAGGDDDGGGGIGVARARDAIEDAVEAFVARPMEAFETWLDGVGELIRQPAGSFVAVTASPRFDAYAADLGWAAPSRVEFVSESAPEGMVVVTGGKKEGSVQVSACLRKEVMEAFRSHVLDW
uniref:Uncharacterized protein n=1 Tax=Leersia perrieri TaxID=77586 RepID=A0A0D9UZV9_9ORYZ